MWSYNNLCLIEKMSKNKIVVIKDAFIFRLKERINILLLMLFGRRWKMILINEYPKCGGTWLRLMVGDLLSSKGYKFRCEKSNAGVEFFLSKCVIQRHWLKYTKFFYKTIIITRDPRDVYNSFYFHENYLKKNSSAQGIYNFKQDNTDKKNMYNYIQSKIFQPELTAPGFSYAKFWDKYKKDRSVYFVKYENLKNDALSELIGVFDYLGYSFDEAKMAEIISKYGVEKMKKNKTNNDERANFVRKGIVGDWKNNFDSKTVELFREYYSGMLIEMKYEKTENWISY